MNLDPNSRLPIYMKLKNAIIQSVKSGELKPGSMMPTEQELCNTYGISRFPVRQAMEELVGEGYLHRTRGRGTFVCEELPGADAAKDREMIGIILGFLGGGFSGQILAGFEKQARKRGYATLVSCSEGNADEELNCIERMVEHGASGILVFLCDESRIKDKLQKLKESGVYIGLLDRNPGFPDLDYVGSDNTGGAYTAVRHLAMQGYRNVVFVSDKSNASSVNERLEGYLKAVSDFGLQSVTRIDIKEDLGRYPMPMYRFFLDQLKDELVDLRKHLPIGIFAVNDGVALQCMRILQAEGMEIGREVGLVGFDNEKECEYAPVPLTSVAQNGLLIGQSAADTAIDKLEGKTATVFKSFVPTQLVIRKSCGE